jgi:Ser/Thr protein kinase RdoA (MazF antagonist)
VALTCHAGQVLSDRTEEVARTFGLGSSVQAMNLAGRGEQGQVWRLDTDRGSFAVKELFVHQDEDDASASVQFQEAVLAAGTVAVPRPVRASSGRVLAQLGPHQVRAYGWVDLLPVDQTLDPVLVGTTLAAVHQVQHAPARPLDSWYTEPVGAQRWQRLLQDAWAAGAPFANGLAEEIPTLLQLEALMAPPRVLQNCHRDLWADNILPTPRGGVCVIDWESCGLEDPAQELPMVLFDFAVGDAERLHDLYAAYVAAGGPGRLRGRGEFTMVIAQFGHFWESAVAAYSTPGASEATRAHSAGRVETLLGQPLRVHHLDETLEVVAGVG